MTNHVEHRHQRRQLPRCVVQLFAPADLGLGSNSGGAREPDGSPWVDRSVRISPYRADGPLAGLTFAAKDIFDVEGHVTGYGSPTWRDTHEPAATTASAIQALLTAGASLEGKAIMDEMAYSMEGQNPHYGTPANPAAPGRIPGGSSSGSAVAVASGEVDIGLGTDTAGSVRVPASYCGLCGFRPSHERVSLQGAARMAPSFDTGAWMTRDAELLRRVGNVLLRFPRQPFTLRRWLVAVDAFAIADPPAANALYEAVAAVKGQIEGMLSPPQEVQVAAVTEADTLTRWADVFSTIQRREVWAVNGDWVRQHKPKFGKGVAERYEAAAQTTDEQARAAIQEQMKIRHHIDDLLAWDAILMVPAAAGAPAAVGSLPEQMADIRPRLLGINSIAGLAGLPQVVLPVARTIRGPIGLGLIGPRGADEALLEFAEQLSGHFKAAAQA